MGWGLWLGFSEPNLEPQWIGISSERVRRGLVGVTVCLIGHGRQKIYELALGSSD